MDPDLHALSILSPSKIVNSKSNQRRLSLNLHQQSSHHASSSRISLDFSHPRANNLSSPSFASQNNSLQSPFAAPVYSTSPRAFVSPNYANSQPFFFAESLQYAAIFAKFLSAASDSTGIFQSISGFAKHFRKWFFSAEYSD